MKLSELFDKFSDDCEARIVQTDCAVEGTMYSLYCLLAERTCKANVVECDIRDGRLWIWVSDANV